MTVEQRIMSVVTRVDMFIDSNGNVIWAAIAAIIAIVCMMICIALKSRKVK